MASDLFGTFSWLNPRNPAWKNLACTCSLAAVYSTPLRETRKLGRQRNDSVCDMGGRIGSINCENLYVISVWNAGTSFTGILDGNLVRAASF